MISLDTVIALTNGFVTVENLNSKQFIKSPSGNNTWLNFVNYGIMKAVLISTESFELTGSYAQKIITPSGARNLRDLHEGDLVETALGEEVIHTVVFIQELQKMAELFTKSNKFYGNGFVLQG